MADKVKPTDIDIANIANAYCRLQMGVEKCGECTGYKNGCCGWLREKIIPITAVRFAIEAWNKRRLNSYGKKTHNYNNKAGSL